MDKDQTPLRITSDPSLPCAVCLKNEEAVAGWLLAPIDNRLNLCADCLSAGPLAAATKLRQHAAELEGDDLITPIVAHREAILAVANWLEGLETWPE